MGQRTVRTVALFLLLVTVVSATLWLRDGVERERTERIAGFVDQVQASATYTSGYTARQGLAYIRNAAAALGPEPSTAELEVYARASGFSAATVYDAEQRVVAAWGDGDPALHLAAVQRSVGLGGPRVAGTGIDGSDVISVALPYLSGRHVAVSADVGDTAVDWYLQGLARTLGAEIALVDEAGFPVLVHGSDTVNIATFAADELLLPPTGQVVHQGTDVVAAAEVEGTPWRLAVAIDEERLHRVDPDASKLPWFLVGLIVLSAIGAVGLVLRLDTIRRRASQVEAEYRRTVDGLQEGIVRTSLQGELEMANAAALHVLGFDDLDTVRAATGGDLTSLMHPDDAAVFQRRLAEEGAVSSQQLRLRRAGVAGADAEIRVSLSAQVVRDDAGRARAFEGLIVDVTERYHAEEELRRRDLILQSATSAASTLLRETEWEAAIAPALATVGEGAGVERVFLFDVTPGEDDLIADYLHEWVGDGVLAAIDMDAMHDIPIRAAGFERWIDVLSQGGVIMGDVSDFPASEQPLLAAVSARSLLVVPIVTREGWWGFVGFAQVTGERVFSSAEAEALRMASEVIAAAVDRSIDHERLKDALFEQARAAEALRVAGQVRDDFLSMVSHELRTPLTPILGFSQLLERPGVHPDHRERGVAAIRRNARRMLGLVDDLLVYSRASSGQVGAIPERVDLEALVGAVLEDLDLCEDVRVLGSGRPVGWIDEAHLGHIVTNLVTNAIKYGGGEVRIEVSTDGSDHVVARVIDEGPGVPVEFVPQLFDRFTQASTGDRRTATGTGLGLAIVQLLAEANGAEVHYRANQPTGACFEVRMAAGDRTVPTAPQPVLA